MQNSGTDSRSGVQAIARAGRVLRALEGAPSGMSLSELAAAVDLPRSTAHRIVSALAEEELVSSGGGAGRIRLGPALVRLGAAASGTLRETLRPALTALRRELDETVDLAILDGGVMRFIDQLAAEHRLRAVSAVGVAFPLHCTANGKAYLAALDPQEREALLPAALERFTAATITDRAALLGELARVRETAVALDREEYTDGVCAAGAAVLERGRPVAAISVPVPAQRFAGREEAIAEAVRRAAGEAGRLLARGG